MEQWKSEKVSVGAFGETPDSNSTQESAEGANGNSALSREVAERRSDGGLKKGSNPTEADIETRDRPMKARGMNGDSEEDFKVPAGRIREVHGTTGERDFPKMAVWHPREQDTEENGEPEKI